MSSKIVRSLSDENPDLHKQIGCMNGIFQLFDRRHFLSGSRQITGQKHRTLSSGQNGNDVKESKNTCKKSTEINQTKIVKEKRRTSTESSRTSFSSTCSSSLSSIECNRPSHPETCSSLSQTRVGDLHNAPSQLSHPSIDLRDVVKDSIYREARGLLVKTGSKSENGGQTLKYFDSPRPLQQPKSSCLKESNQVVQSPHKSRERNHVSSRRYSCDGRESRDRSKSAVKLKDLPRLSLDSKAGSTNERKSDNLLGNSGNSFLYRQEEPESRTRLSNVVAKLMGLEAFPDSMSTVENQMRQSSRYPDAETRTTDENKQTRIPASPLSSSHLRNLPSSKFPIEPAPWKQSDGSSKGRVAQTKSPNTPLSVYGEIEKRLTHLEFKKSGKDLRALKQILEAMHKTKEILETRNEVENLGNQKSNDRSLHQYPISALPKNPDSPKSPIVIMKPGKVAQRAGNKIPSENAIEGFVKNPESADEKESIGRRTSKESSLRTNNLAERSSLSSRLIDKNTACRWTGKSQSSNHNIRQPKKKFGLEKQNLSSDSIRSRRQCSKQLTESGSPRRKHRPTPSSLQLSNDECSDTGSEARELSHHGDSMSLQSESSLASQVDDEVSSIDRSKQSYQRQKPVARLVKDRSIAELKIPCSEQPSPVSVLDATFYVDDLPSPIKKKSIAFKDDHEWNPSDANHLYSGTHYILNSEIIPKKTENTHPVIQNFIQMLSAEKESFLGKYSGTNPEHQYISEILLASGFLNELEYGCTIHLRQTGYPISPDVFLALEQVKASMMVSNGKETSTKASQSKLKSKRRKLVFDVVNEILTDKFHLESPYKRCCMPNTLANKGLRGQELLGELCSEVDRLQANALNLSLDDEDDTLAGIIEEDMKHQSTHWTACSSEIPGLVLDVERLIFKDLITELVTCQTLGLEVQADGRCRQLHSK